MTNLTTMLIDGANNPSCSFYVGAFTGQFVTIAIVLRILLLFMVAYFGFRVIDKLAFTPLLNYLVNKLFKKKDKTK
jgi:hypothetical protein